jgi:cytochrome c peroxidase
MIKVSLHAKLALLAFAGLSIFSMADPGHGKNGIPDPVRDQDFYDDGAPSEAKVELGNLLFFDKILSGNKNTSCATCHHSFTATSDGLSLPIGEGGRGFSVARDTGTGTDAIHERVPRNSPHIFNLGAKEFSFMFHDGRVTADDTQPSGFLTPAGNDFPTGLDNPLAAQAMFPVTSPAEMAGQPSDGNPNNTIADAAAIGDLAGPNGVWAQLGQRLREIPEYVDLFKAAYDDVNEASDITYVHAANAIGAFEAFSWRADNSPFDRYLRGAKDAMSDEALSGMRLFYGAAKCAECHSGVFQSDQSFHSIAMPQIGPGKGDGASGHEDFGRARETGDTEDLYKFRTPTLRNTALTGPWGHAGSYNSLESVVRHHLDPVASLNNYDQNHAVLPSRPDLDLIDFVVQDDDVLRGKIAAANELSPRKLKDSKVDDLMAFLQALTDPASLDLRIDVPMTVPSGLPVSD